jgi:TPP-dependent pyruvate/acetoin dehydrogenase alpha subunit
MPGFEVDGNDLDAVRRAMTEAIARAREGKGPSLIEARTWRAKGHWAADPQEYRATHPDTPMADPLARYGDRLIQRGEASRTDLDRLRDAARAAVAATLEAVQALPDTGEAELGLDEVHP